MEQENNVKQVSCPGLVRKRIDILVDSTFSPRVHQSS
jgi:hypothetical protein